MNKESLIRKIGMYTMLVLLMLSATWGYQTHMLNTGTTFAQAMPITNHGIPDESLRLRILAHSDESKDQWLKEKVRDAIVQKIHGWANNLESIDATRNKISQSLEELEEVVHQVIAEHGRGESFNIEFGDILFPVKLYGDQLYPADEYEGLLITLGAGQGKNWWCVLFPPLCFVDFDSGEYVEIDAEQSDEELAAEKEDSQEERDSTGEEKDVTQEEQAAQEKKDFTEEMKDSAQEESNALEDVEVKFFLVELWHDIKSIFS